MIHTSQTTKLMLLHCLEMNQKLVMSVMQTFQWFTCHCKDMGSSGIRYIKQPLLPLQYKDYNNYQVSCYASGGIRDAQQYTGPVLGFIEQLDKKTEGGLLWGPVDGGAGITGKHTLQSLQAGNVWQLWMAVKTITHLGQIPELFTVVCKHLNEKIWTMYWITWTKRITEGREENTHTLDIPIQECGKSCSGNFACAVNPFYCLLTHSGHHLCHNVLWEHTRVHFQHRQG